MFAHEPKEGSDPILAAIELHRKLEDEADDLFNRIEQAKANVSEQAPTTMVQWRNCSALGGPEIERARDEFLKMQVVDPRQIEREFEAKKAEQGARLQVENDWYHRHGIAPLYQRHENLVRELRAAEERLFKIQPTSIVGAATLVAYVHAELVCCANAGLESGPNWTLPALANAVEALRIIHASSERSTLRADATAGLSSRLG
jgi:hypothetical protein